MMAKTGCCHGLHPHMRGRFQSAPYAGGVNIPLFTSMQSFTYVQSCHSAANLRRGCLWSCVAN